MGDLLPVLAVMVISWWAVQGIKIFLGRKYHIQPEEAMRIMKEDHNARVVDVRNRSEYEQGHIPGAICIPLNEIESTDLLGVNEKILVYCQMGSRSREAVRKLAKMGYTDVHEFGGLNKWTGNIVKGNE